MNRLDEAWGTKKLGCAGEGDRGRAVVESACRVFPFAVIGL